MDLGATKMQNCSQWEVISALKILFCIENIWRKMFQKYFWAFKMASQSRTEKGGVRMRNCGGEDKQHQPPTI